MILLAECLLPVRFHTGNDGLQSFYGNYLDFLDVYRYEKEIEDTLEWMTDKEKETFINLYFSDIPDEMPNPMSKKAYLETELIHLKNENTLYRDFIQYRKLEADFDKYREPKFRFASDVETDALPSDDVELPFREVLS